MCDNVHRIRCTRTDNGQNSEMIEEFAAHFRIGVRAGGAAHTSSELRISGPRLPIGRPTRQCTSWICWRCMQCSLQMQTGPTRVCQCVWTAWLINRAKCSVWQHSHNLEQSAVVAVSNWLCVRVHAFIRANKCCASMRCRRRRRNDVDRDTFIILDRDRNRREGNPTFLIRQQNKSAPSPLTQTYRHAHTPSGLPGL